MRLMHEADAARACEKTQQSRKIGAAVLHETDRLTLHQATCHVCDQEKEGARLWSPLRMFNK